MVINAEKIAQMELELADAKAQFLQEDGKRYQIVMREIDPEEKQRILDHLTDRTERILFGLEAPERSTRPGKSGGNLECPICHKKGLTELGLKLHTARIHKEGQGRGEVHADMFATEGVKSTRRRTARASEEQEEEHAARE